MGERKARNTRGLRRCISSVMTMILVLLAFTGSGAGWNSGERVHAKENAGTASATEATEENPNKNIYTGDGFEVGFHLDNKWDTGYSATITIKNTGEYSIENWCMSFPLKQKISNIWNANISKTYDNFYVVKNAGWNQDIAAGSEVSFGITVYEAFTEFPAYYTMIGKEIAVTMEDYTVDYTITEDWGDGYKAEITITNKKRVPLEDWRLSFDYGENLITNIWNAQILVSAGGRYEIGCASYNQNIPANGNVTFGIMVEPGCSGNGIENISLMEKKTDLSEGQAIVVGYMEDEKELGLGMLASVEVNKYEIYASYEGGAYKKLGETEDGYSSHTLNETFNKMEIYVLA